MTDMIRRICVFCGSSSGNGPRFIEAAQQLGEQLIQRDMDLVYGGSDVGLMGTIARTMLSGGREVHGVIPRTLHEQVDQLRITDLIIVESMHERKAAMYELADAFIAMPGGIGTFEELFETCTWNQLGYLKKPAAVLNVHGYYDPMLDQLRKAVAMGFMKQEHLDALVVSDDPAELLDLLVERRIEYIPKWQ